MAIGEGVSDTVTFVIHDLPRVIKEILVSIWMKGIEIVVALPSWVLITINVIFISLVILVFIAIIKQKKNLIYI